MSKFILRCIVCLLVFACGISSSAQLVPSGISYQGVLRGPDGLELQDESITVEFAIRQGAADGTIVYEENHPLVATNQFGLFQAVIGSGIYTGIGAYPNLTSIPWESGPYFMEVRATIPGEGDPQLIGVSQLLTVPYALYAEQATSVLNESDGDPFNEVITGVSVTSSQLIIEEGDSSFGIDLALLQGEGDSDVTNELITSVSASSPTEIEIAEGNNIISGDLSSIAFNTWSRNGSNVHNNNDRIGIGTSQPNSSFDLNGSFAAAVRVINAQSTPLSDNLGIADHVLICNVTLGDITLNLPDAGLCEGRMYKIRKLFSGVSTTNNISLVPVIPGQTIDLNSSYVMSNAAAEYATVISDGSNWFIIDHSKE